MPTRSTLAFETMRTITGVGESERSTPPATTACAAAAPESKGRTSTSTPCFLKKPWSFATNATRPEKTGGTPGTAIDKRSTGASPALQAAPADRQMTSDQHAIFAGVVILAPPAPGP